MHSKPCAAYDEPPIVPGYFRKSVVKIYGDKWGGNHSDPRPYTSGTTPGATEELITRINPPKLALPPLAMLIAHAQYLQTV